MKIEETLVAAKEALVGEEYRSALNLTSSALKIDDRSYEAWTMAGEAYRGLGQLEKSLECCDKATRIDSKATTAWFRKGNIYHLMGANEKAIECFNKVINIDPKYIKAWFNKGVIYHLLGVNEKAIECYDEVTDIDPKNSAAWFNKAFSYNLLEKHEEAIECWGNVTKINPKDVDAWCNKGDTYLVLERYEEANECYNMSIKIDPKKVHAWFKKGDVYHLMKVYKKAVKCYDNATTMDSNHTVAWNGKAYAYFTLKDYKKALICWQKVIEIDPKYADAWHNKGCCYFSMKMYDEAIECFNEVTGTDIGFTNSLFNKGVCYYHLKEYEEAIESFSAATDIHPGNALAWYYNGQIFAIIEELQEAANCFRRAYKENSSQINLPELLRVYKQKLDDPLFVQRVFHEFPALHFSPDLDDYAQETQLKLSDMLLFIEAINSGEFSLGEKDALLTNGMVFYYHGDAEMALRCFDLLREIDDMDLSVKYYYIISLQSLEMNGHADAVLDDVLQRYQEFIDVSERSDKQKYYAALLLGFRENYETARRVLTDVDEAFLPALYVRYSLEKKLDPLNAQDILFSILKQEEQMLLTDYRGFLFPHSIGEIYVDEKNSVINPVRYHAISQEIWEPIQMVLKAAEEVAVKRENDLPAIKAKLKSTGDYYRSTPFMGSLKFKEEFIDKIENYLNSCKKEELLIKAKKHLRLIEGPKWRTFFLLDQQSIMPDECERVLAETLKFMGSGYVSDYPDVNHILIFFLLSGKLKPQAFFMLAAYSAFLVNREVEIDRKKSLLQGIKKMAFITKVASTVNVYTFGAVFTLSALFDVALSELSNYGPDALDAYIETLGIVELSYVDFKQRYSEFLSHEHNRLGSEEFAKIYSVENIFKSNENGLL